ncbi:MAG: N-6 DNA methylase [Fervidicoccaceae archaeon]
METEELRPETLEYIRSRSPEYRAMMGQYFTPKSLRREVLRRIPRLIEPKVLDPACGTGEFLVSAREHFVRPKLFCWEIDPELGKIAKKLIPDAQIEIIDSLAKPFSEEFDVVVTNPPYYEFKPSDEIREKFEEILWGRVNIYSLFIYLAVRVVKPGGYVGLVVSSSMNNGAYFRKLREYIAKNTSIEYMKVLDGSRIFSDANHTFQILVMRKRGKGELDLGNENYVLDLNGSKIFSEEAGLLRKTLNHSYTLRELGYSVRTGKIVWNKNKEKLVDNPRDGILLIWSHNIRDGKLVLENKPGKPQYIVWPEEKADRGPAIVTSRIVGHPKRASLRASLVPEGTIFVAENHVNVIYPRKSAPMRELLAIVRWLNSPEAQKVIRAITGNTQVSKNELERIIPIRLDF